jgi:hypothetical protein
MNNFGATYRRFLSLAAVLAVGATLAWQAGVSPAADEYKSGKIWPEPKVVDPGPPGGLPPDAMVLFDGTDMSAFEGRGAANWIVRDGVATVRGGGVSTRQAFGDCHLHVEWASPAEVSGSGQGRGNSGIYLMGKYEIQILDSYNNPTYPDGSAGALYKQKPPLVNASRKPGEWQTFDIIFKAPRFDGQKLVRPGYVTVLHNGIVVQNNTEIEGTTAYDRPPQYEPHPEKLPLYTQDHGNPVRFRNIWIRELGNMEPINAN